MNRHTDGCVRAAIRYVSLSRSLSGVVALRNTLCFHARARAGYVFAYSSARVNVVNYISRSSLTCKHQTLQRGPSAPRVNSALSVPSDDRQ